MPASDRTVESPPTDRLGTTTGGPDETTYIGGTIENVDYGNIPRHGVSPNARYAHQTFTPLDSTQTYKSTIAKRFALDSINLGQQGCLDLSDRNPQVWNQTVESWKRQVIRTCTRELKDPTTEQLYRYMETFLGVADGAVWNTFRREFPNSIAELYKLGPNPFNFVNSMGRLLTGSTELQKKAATYLDQIV